MSLINTNDLERVMEVAGQLFAQHGFDGVGIREIAKQADVKTSTIFYHFGSKKSLYDEVLDYKYEATASRILNEIECLQDPKEKLNCTIGSLFDTLLRDREMLLMVQRDLIDIIAQKPCDRFNREYSAFIDLTSTLLEKALGKPIQNQMDFSLLSLILGFCELTVAIGMNKSLHARQQWCAKQRHELIEVGKRVCLIS